MVSNSVQFLRLGQFNRGPLLWHLRVDVLDVQETSHSGMKACFAAGN
jgi:hypothetical protein